MSRLQFGQARVFKLIDACKADSRPSAREALGLRRADDTGRDAIGEV
jgi:hypothetical protein